MPQSTPWMSSDEPLAALNPGYEIDLIGHIQALSWPGADVRAPVVVQHVLAMTARYAEWIICPKDGRPFRSAARAEIMNRPTLIALFDTAITAKNVKDVPVVIVE